MAALAALVLLVMIAAAQYAGRRRAVVVAGGDARRLHSRPLYHGHLVALWVALPALLVLAVGLFVAPRVLEGQVLAGASDTVRALPAEHLERFLADARALATGDVLTREATPELEAAAANWARARATLGGLLVAAVALVAGVGGVLGYRRISLELRARNAVERIVRAILAAASVVAILVTIGIVLSLVFEAMRFFARVPPTEFLFGTVWSPQTAIRVDQVAAEGAFGAVPVFAGTLLITVIAMSVAVPVGLLSAIYLSEYASESIRAWVKPLLEILAGIPTVVYGFFAALTVAPLIRSLGASAGLDVASESALAAGLIMGLMIVPFVSSLSDDVINAVPQSLREGSLALGATPSETVRRVVLPAALPGIMAAILLAVSRAIGETMIVLMAAGSMANMTANPFEAVTTVTVQIVTLLVGDQEFDSAKTLSAFALGLVLFFVTLVLNVIALATVRRYREQYD